MEKGTFDKTELFETLPIPKAVVKLCAPAAVTTLVMIVYSLSDTFFVGALNDSYQTAGVTLAAPVLLAFNAINNLFGVGTGSLMSRSLGKKDYNTVKKCSSYGFYGAIFASLLFATLCTVFNSGLLNLLGADNNTAIPTKNYLFWTVTLGTVPAILNVILGYLVRSEGSSLHAAIGTMSGCILNIFLDPVFILPWGFNMGASGAGCATFISNTIATLYFLIIIAYKKKKGVTYISLKPEKGAFSKTIIKEVCFIGVPASIQNLLNVTGMTILNNFTAVYGAAAVSAMGISHKVAMLPMYLSMGISQGIMPLIGYNFANHNVKRMKEGLLFTMKISLTIIIVVSALFCFFSSSLTPAFMKDKEVVSIGSKLLVAMSIGQVFLCIDFIGVGVYQACGMGMKSFFFAIARKIILEIPALFVLDKLYPLYGLGWAQTFAELVLSIATATVLVKMFRRLEKENHQ